MGPEAVPAHCWVKLVLGSLVAGSRSSEPGLGLPMDVAEDQGIMDLLPGRW